MDKLYNTTLSSEPEIKKHELIESIYKNEFRKFMTTATVMNIDKMDRIDAIHSFIDKKLYSKTIEELEEIINKGSSYILAIFRNFIIDHYRCTRRRMGIIEKMKSEGIIIKEDPDEEKIDDRMNRIIEKCRILIIGQHGEEGIKLFEMILRGCGEEEISKALGISISASLSRKYRLINFLRTQAASLF